MYKTILVRSPNWIGDQILAFPFFYYLRKTFPNARITSACVSWVKDLQYTDLINEVFVLPSPRYASVIEKVRALNQAASDLRKRCDWDLALSLPNSLSAAWLIYRSGARIRRGYRLEGRGLLLNDGLRWNPSAERHRAQAYLDLLPGQAHPDRRAIDFWGIPPMDETDPGTPAVLSGFDPSRSWTVKEVVKPPEEKYWVLAPGATAESRRWPIERFAQLSERIHQETGLRGVVVGGAGEASLAAYLCKDPRLKLLDRTAMGPVSCLWKIFKNALFTVTNESGLAHMASLCGSPVQIVCGAANPTRTRPLGPGKVQVSLNAVDCWPCEKNYCMQPSDQKLKCLKGIEPDLVWEEIKRGFLDQKKTASS